MSEKEVAELRERISKILLEEIQVNQGDPVIVSLVKRIENAIGTLLDDLTKGPSS